MVQFVLSRPSGYFKHKILFIGNLQAKFCQMTLYGLFWGPYLWSKNGENKTWSQSAVDCPDDKGTRIWNSPQDFLNTNDEQYEQAYVIPTTEAQDKQITEGFRKSQDINYDFFKANCASAVQSGLKAAGLKDGSLSRLEKNILKFAPIGNMNKLYIELSPVHVFSRIKNQNKNGVWLKRHK